MDAALYDPADGFYTAGGRAGRAAGDFLTSPEVGPLFGAVLARALDAWWERARPARPVRGGRRRRRPGTLARAVLAARPAVPSTAPCATSPSSGRRRSGRRHAGLAWSRVADAAGRAVRRASWSPTSCSTTCRSASPSTTAAGARPASTSTPDGRLVEVLVGRSIRRARRACRRRAAHGARAPRAGRGRGAGSRDALGRLGARAARGASTTPSTTADAGGAAVAGVAAHLPRPRAGRALPRRSRARRTSPATSPSTSSPPPDARRRTQAEFLGAHGIDELVEEGRRTWAAPRRGARPRRADAPRSRVREAEALIDPAGLGGFTVAEWLIA